MDTSKPLKRLSKDINQSAGHTQRTSQQTIAAMHPRRAVALAWAASSAAALQAPRQPRTPRQRQPTTTRRVATLEPPPTKKPLRLKLTSPEPTNDFVKPDGTLDVIPFSAQAEYELKPRQRVIGIAYISTLAAVVASSRIPAFFRLLGLQYAAFSAFEYCFHRWCMHSTYGTWRDKIFSRWNRLHVQHHLDTNADMTMVEGYNWKGTDRGVPGPFF